MQVETSIREPISAAAESEIQVLLDEFEARYPWLDILRQLAAAADRNRRLEEAEHLFEPSPMLGREVLSLARADALGGTAYDSIVEAASDLGWHRLAEIVGVALTRGLAEAVSESAQWDALLFYRRSLAAGEASRRLALEGGDFRSDFAFLAGLLQEWGYLVLAHSEPEAFDAIAWSLGRSGPESPIAPERDRLGFDHAWLGARLAERLGFPSELVNGIAGHHETGRADEAEQTAADIAHLASWLAGRMGFSLVYRAANHPLDASALRRMGWSIDDLESMMEIVTERAASIYLRS